MKAPALLLSMLLLAAPVLAPSWAQDGAQDSAGDAPSPEEAARLEREAAGEREAAAQLAAQADEQASEIESLQRALVDAARERSVDERAALGIESRLNQLETEEAALAARIEADRESLRDVFAALARIERGRPPALLASGSDALAAARAANLLADVAPALEQRAAEALDRLDQLAAVRRGIADEQGALDDADVVLAAQGEQIAALIASRTEELDRLRADSAERTASAQALAAQAQTLRELIAALEERGDDFEPGTPGSGTSSVPTPRLKPRGDEVGERPAPFEPPTGRFADARGALVPPVVGDVVAGYGDAHAGGVSQGMWFRTRGGALVTSPYDARIEYVGEFRGYQRLLILSVGDHYHLVLAGLGELNGAAGQTVLAGEPIGLMSDSEGTSPELYVEIRKDAEQIDPEPWWRGAQ